MVTFFLKIFEIFLIKFRHLFHLMFSKSTLIVIIDKQIILNKKSLYNSFAKAFLLFLFYFTLIKETKKNHRRRFTIFPRCHGYECVFDSPLPCLWSQQQWSEMKARELQYSLSSDVHSSQYGGLFADFPFSTKSAITFLASFSVTSCSK